MNFITIGQYFNKLQSALFFLMIIPLLVFISRSFFGVETSADPATEYFIILPAIVFLDWLMAVILINKKIKLVRNQQGLGAKLDKYFSLSILRYAMISAGSLGLAAGLYLTSHEMFTWIFIAGLIFSAMLWPTARKVSNDLRLKGAEREMVYFKKDTV